VILAAVAMMAMRRLDHYLAADDAVEDAFQLADVISDSRFQRVTLAELFERNVDGNLHNYPSCIAQATLTLR
jgi:hypothetical protein